MTRTLLQQAFDALHPQANRAFVEATKDALRSALAAPQPEPVAHLWKFASGELVVWGGDPKDGGSRVFPVYAAPPAAPAPAVPDAVLDSLGMHDAAVKLARRLGYAWSGGEWSAAPAAAVSAERDARIKVLEDALTKIDAIRNDIIGRQKIGWSSHVYPLVAALDEAGYPGMEYKAARAALGDKICSG